VDSEPVAKETGCMNTDVSPDIDIDALWKQGELKTLIQEAFQRFKTSGGRLDHMGQLTVVLSDSYEHVGAAIREVQLFDFAVSRVTFSFEEEVRPSVEVTFNAPVSLRDLLQEAGIPLSPDEEVFEYGEHTGYVLDLDEELSPVHGNLELVIRPTTLVES
jgi:hypothetical protein